MKVLSAFASAAVLTSAVASNSSVVSAPRSKRVTTVPDFDVFAFDAARTQTKTAGLSWFHDVGIVPSTGRSYSAFRALIENPAFLSIVGPDEPDVHACKTYARTSATAKQRGCIYSTNAGFFQINNLETQYYTLCEGIIVEDCTIVQTWQRSPDDGFEVATMGITFDNTYVTGYFPTTMDLTRFRNVIGGRGWLVRDGASYVEKSQDLGVDAASMAFVAPRTVIGFFPNGTALLYEVDGEEDIEEGVDFLELTELLLGLGVHSAINLDGGGSSTVTYDGKVINEPTCIDTPLVCQRPLTTITCVRADGYEPEFRLALS